MEEIASNPAQILIVDDDAGAREALELLLEDTYEITLVDSGSAAVQKFNSETFDLVLLDVTMPGMDGIETLEKLKAIDSSIDVIMVSATDRAYEATASIKTGAYDYITKPIEPDALLNIVRRAIQKRRLELEVQFLRSEVSNLTKGQRIIGQSACMQQVFLLVDKVAMADSSVLITGESGTGKELIAQAIHNNSERSKHPFVAINCAAIPPELMESELYGHEKGAFTGAIRRHAGKFEIANKGTIFLDEISSLKLELQAKLLRFLQEREYTRVGGSRAIRADIRMIAATNISLKELINTGEFREDLFFRLNVIPIDLPPLRKRDDDIYLLTNYFLDRFKGSINHRIKGITPRAMAVLKGYHWPGNIRELENLIERLVVLSSERRMIEVEDLPLDLHFDTGRESTDPSMEQGLLPARKIFERRYIQRALRLCQGNQLKTAKMLKIHRNTLLQKMKNLQIDANDLKQE